MNFQTGFVKTGFKPVSKIKIKKTPRINEKETSPQSLLSRNLSEIARDSSAVNELKEYLRETRFSYSNNTVLTRS